MDVVVGIDPGKEKCGVAIVALDGRVVDRALVAPGELVPYLSRVADEYRVRGVALGDRTGSRAVEKGLREAGLEGRLGGITYVDEHWSTVQGRRLYWKSRPPQGWRRLIPLGMQTPPEPYDAWVAEVLARRFLAGGDLLSQG